MTAGLVIGTPMTAQPYKRCPSAPAPADSSCQARFGTSAARTSAQNSPRTDGDFSRKATPST